MKNTLLTVKDVTDIEEIKSIILDPEIYDRITDDKCPALSKYEFSDPFGCRYIGGYLDGKLFGLLICHDDEIHFQVMKPYRKGNPKSLFLQRAIEMLGKAVTAEIPALYPEVIHFAKQEGFREERIIKNGFRKHGKNHDKYILVHS